MDFCLFCNKEEPNYKPGKNIEFLCSNCVQLFTDLSQEDLRRYHKLTTDKGFIGKATALAMFIEEEQYESTNKRRQPTKHSDRKRTAGIARFKKERSFKIKERKTLTLSSC